MRKSPSPRKIIIDQESPKPLHMHPIANYWKNQIEQSNNLDTSNIQCQVEGTYEMTYQTLDVSIASLNLDMTFLANVYTTFFV